MVRSMRSRVGVRQRTALSRAVAASNETVVDLLLTRGANVTV